MRVALIAYSLEDYAVEYANALSSLCRVTLFASRPKMARYTPFVKPEVDLRVFAWPRMRSLRNASFLPRLARAIRATSPEIVHNLSPTFFWFGALAKRLGNARSFTTVHDVRPHRGDAPSAQVPHSLVRWGARKSHAVVVHGRALRDRIAEELPLELGRVFEAPHPVLLRYRELAGSLTPQKDDFLRVLCFGRMLTYKGIPELVRCEQRVAQQRADVQFVVAGSGPALARARQQAAPTAKIQWLDRFIPDLETAQLFLDSDVVALPYYEGSQSGVLALASVFGKPVVATRVGSISEVVESSEMGLIVEPGDAKALADAVLALAEDPALRNKLADGSRQLAETSWSHANVAKRGVEIYRAGKAVA